MAWVGFGLGVFAHTVLLVENIFLSTGDFLPYHPLRAHLPVLTVTSPTASFLTTP